MLPNWLESRAKQALSQLDGMQLKELCARRLTAFQVADILGVSPEDVRLARVALSIPSQTIGSGLAQQPNPAFQEWLDSYFWWKEGVV